MTNRMNHQFINPLARLDLGKIDTLIEDMRYGALERRLANLQAEFNSSEQASQNACSCYGPGLLLLCSSMVE